MQLFWCLSWDSSWLRNLCGWQQRQAGRWLSRGLGCLTAEREYRHCSRSSARWSATLVLSASFVWNSCCVDCWPLRSPVSWLLHSYLFFSCWAACTGVRQLACWVSVWRNHTFRFPHSARSVCSWDFIFALSLELNYFLLVSAQYLLFPLSVS